MELAMIVGITVSAFVWWFLLVQLVIELDKEIKEKKNMEEDNMKEVYYDQYCKTCEHSSKAEDDEPCCECLDEPARPESHKPARYEEKISRR